MTSGVNTETLFSQFVRIPVTGKIKSEAQNHAIRRTQYIKRQFRPAASPLSHLESNFIGCLGELITFQYFAMDLELQANYAKQQMDNGDLHLSGKIYDVKTDAVMKRFYHKIYTGNIREYEPYGCRVFTAKHLHHLEKYTGGLIFAVFPIPDDAKKDKIEGKLRQRIIQFIGHGLLVGYIPTDEIQSKSPTWYSPADPSSGKRRKYNSKNFIFHHSELYPVTALKEIHRA
jgi:hypothetical protein